MASGVPEAFKKAAAVLDAIAAKVYRLGDTAGMGSKIKMINQLLAGVHIAASAEAVALGIRAGADPKVIYEVISTAPVRRGCSRTGLHYRERLRRCRP
jgi:3-hydroxyisobutyrate dehydrogenase